MATQEQDDVLGELHEELPGLMHAHDPDPYRADYQCAFCRERPRTNAAQIEHDPRCLGVRLLARLGTRGATVSSSGAGVRFVLTVENVPPEQAAAVAAALAQAAPRPEAAHDRGVPGFAVAWQAGPNQSKIPAIKALRDLTGCSLKEGKDAVDAACAAQWPVSVAWATTRGGAERARRAIEATGMYVRVSQQSARPVGSLALLPEREE